MSPFQLLTSVIMITLPSSTREPLIFWHRYCRRRGLWDGTGLVYSFQIVKQILTRQQGMAAQITKAVLSQALLFMSKEQFEQWALAIMIFLARLR